MRGRRRFFACSCGALTLAGSAGVAFAGGVCGAVPLAGGAGEAMPGPAAVWPAEAPVTGMASRMAGALAESATRAGLGVQAVAGEQEPRVVMEVGTTAIYLGDPVSVLLRVDHPADWSVAWPDSLAAGPFEVLRYETTPPVVADDGSASSSAGVVLTSFELGELEIPAIEIPVVDPGGAARSLFTDPFRIGVESVGIDESGDIREIRGPLTIARNWWLLAPWLLLVAAVGAGGIWLRGRLRKRPVAEVATRQQPPRPHSLVALEALDELERSSLLERGRVKRWHVRVSEIVRTYVEGQLEVPALEMTTGEVVAGLREAALGGRLVDRFRTFLERCDLVKFARLRPGAEASREVLAMARALVEMTSGPGSEADATPSSGDGASPVEESAGPAASGDPAREKPAAAPVAEAAP